MKKILKWGLIVFFAAGAFFVASSFYLDAKRKGCTEGVGRQAIEDCGFLIKGHTAGYSAEYLLRRAQLLEKEKRWDEVISDLNQVISSKEKVQPAQVLAAYTSLVRINSQKGNSAEVRKYLELAVQNGSKDPGILIGLAGIYIEEKQFQEALGLLAGAGEVDKARKHPYYNMLASAYEGLNDYQKAYAALKEALTVSAPRPVLAATSKHLGLVCFELKSYKEAETYLSYSLRAGLDCPECGLLLTTIRGALEPSAAPVRRAKGTRNQR